MTDLSARSPFVLFIAARSANSMAALANLQRALAALGRTIRDVAVVDVYEQPDAAAAANVFVTPTLVRRDDPAHRLTGDLSAHHMLAEFLQ